LDMLPGLGKAMSAVGQSVEKVFCFTGDTKVLTACGQMPIEQIQLGWYVWAADPNTGKPGLFEVTKCFKREADSLVTITASNQTVKATPNHPFYVYGKGWQQAGTLTAGAEIVDVNNMPVAVDKMELVHGKVTVYNLEVDHAHAYYVSDAKLLVHNGPCNVPGKPFGSLTKLKEWEIKLMKLDPHKAKGKFGRSRLDIYKDEADFLWTKAKGDADEFAQFLGSFGDQFK
jgi:hypothetical protein